MKKNKVAISVQLEGMHSVQELMEILAGWDVNELPPDYALELREWYDRNVKHVNNTVH